ncbi:hypothetical protein J6590_016067 [Homalodisca vitripennis]|nr:hypothetical protein J6590_016067 [Homalodisca vitripennis]
MPGKYRFQDNWAATHGWNLWLRKGKDIYEGFCSFCNKNIDISVAGVFALKTHVNSKRHSDFQRQLTSGKQITLHSLKSETRISVEQLSYRKPLPILRQRSKSSGLVDKVIAESHHLFS